MSRGGARTDGPSRLTRGSFPSLGFGSEAPQALSLLRFRFPALPLGARHCQVEGTAQIMVVMSMPLTVCRVDLYARFHGGLNDAPSPLLKGMSTFQTWSTQFGKGVFADVIN